MDAATIAIADDEKTAKRRIVEDGRTTATRTKTAASTDRGVAMTAEMMIDGQDATMMPAGESGPGLGRPAGIDEMREIGLRRIAGESGGQPRLPADDRYQEAASAITSLDSVHTICCLYVSCIYFIRQAGAHSPIRGPCI